MIALGITAFGDREFGTTLVYAQSIGLTIWVLIDLGRHWLITDPKNQAQRLVWIAPVSVMVRYLIGTILADGQRSRVVPWGFFHWARPAAHCQVNASCPD